MNLVLGGSGRVGSTVIEALIPEEPVLAVIRNRKKAEKLREKASEVKIANYLDENNMKAAFEDVKTAFLITPENIKSPDIFEENEILLKNYKIAIKANGVKKIVGLSSMGAQHDQGTGNLLLSHNLEKLNSKNLEIKIFLRPAYYYSNWMNYLPIIQEQGILPSFFPPELKIPMISPKTVGQFAANLIKNKTINSQTIELEGPERYSANDIAKIFSDVLKQNVKVQPIPLEKWEENLDKAGFSESAKRNLIKMTEAVINGKARPEKNPQKAGTTFYEYLNEKIN